MSHLLAHIRTIQPTSCVLTYQWLTCQLTKGYKIVNCVQHVKCIRWTFASR
jgi:hypothetical protein